MKKTKFIALALVIVTTLMGVGYAQWRDTLKIESTVNSGNLNVEFVQHGSLFPYIKTLEGNSQYVDAHIAQTDSKTVAVTVDKLYPGSGVLYGIEFKNTGSIPAKIKSVTVDFTRDNNLLKNNLTVVGGFMQISSNGMIVNGGVFPSSLKSYYLKDLQGNLNEMLKDIVLQPGDYIVFDIPQEKKNDISNILKNEGIEGFNPDQDNCIIMGLPNSVDNTLQKQSIQFSIKLNFKQFNQ